MSYTFVNKTAVSSDIISVVKYYKSISPKLALEFLFRLREAKKHIIRSPRGFQIKYNNVRTVMLKQFPYHLHYFIDEELKQIVVLAVIHAYKNPKDYSERE